MKDGVYTTSAADQLSAAGHCRQADQDRRKDARRREIAGTHGFDVAGPAAHVEIDGFLLTHASGRDADPLRRDATSASRATSSSAPATAPTSRSPATTREIDRNEFRNKSTLGNMIDVRGAGSQIAQRVWIHHNYFHDFTSPGGQRRRDDPLRAERPEHVERVRRHRAQPVRPLHRRERADLDQVELEHHPLQHDPRLARRAAHAAPRQRQPRLRATTCATPTASASSATAIRCSATISRATPAASTSATAAPKWPTAHR